MTEEYDYDPTKEGEDEEFWYGKFATDYLRVMDQLEDESYIPDSEGNPQGFTITNKEEYDAYLGMQGYYWMFPY
jgi:hypothetical protein